MAFLKLPPLEAPPAGTHVPALGWAATTRQRALDKVTVTSGAPQPPRASLLGSGTHALAGMPL